MEYGHNQVSMVSNRMLPSAISSENILAMAAGSGKSSESSSRSLSPESSSGQRTVVQPSRPARKRRPAPKPPAKPAPQPPNTQKKDAPVKFDLQYSIFLDSGSSVTQTSPELLIRHYLDLFLGLQPADFVGFPIK
ncbi:unnamed protein product [Nesidiocoris tenuis]|uniref:Uncharacterized protein n=1 Tax=Nesidiocoris tenuis TaxID=355587 RepID=A0A6H5HMN8_9HEMI|nr:unnamed protein product [Nesidiocoris tenuis]